MLEILLECSAGGHDAVTVRPVTRGCRLALDHDGNAERALCKSPSGPKRLEALSWVLDDVEDESEIDDIRNAARARGSVVGIPAKGVEALR
jgi:hypothetical protein